MAFENRYRPLLARRAMKKLREDPDDTAQAIRVISALSGNSGKRAFTRFSRSPLGQQILREKRDLQSTMDIQRLRAMPDNSLGKAIADWYELEELSAQGLADASEAAFSEGGPRRAQLSSDEDLFSKRLLDLHDVFQGRLHAAAVGDDDVQDRQMARVTVGRDGEREGRAGVVARAGGGNVAEGRDGRIDADPGAVGTDAGADRRGVE